MQYVASLGLLFDFICFLAINYQLSWSVSAKDLLGTAWRRVSQRTAQRCYYLTFVLAIAAIVAMVVHFVARNVMNTWPEVTPLCLGIAGLMLVLAIILELAVVRQF